ncbi:MAG: RNA polymerase sigma factor [Pseudobdellovibrionaceae bacterium]
MTIPRMDVQKWDRVVEEIGPRLYRYFKYKGASDLASDLTQETFIRLIGTAQRFDSAQGPLIAFALGIAQNIWRENLRKTKPLDPLDEAIDLPANTDLHLELENLDQGQKLKAIISRLSQIQQDILYFYFDEEITTREIAEILEKPEGTIKSHLHRAKETIRLILEKEWS